MSKMFTPNSPSSTSNYAKVFSHPNSTHHKENNINGLFHLENSHYIIHGALVGSAVGTLGLQLILSQSSVHT
jgi:hypothetical protein